jgi:hypothetical protein
MPRKTAKQTEGSLAQMPDHALSDQFPWKTKLNNRESFSS